MTQHNLERVLPSALRDILREEAASVSQQLSRSVARRTSVEPEAYTEYFDEIKAQKALSERLFYLQYCRNALEQCIETGHSSVRWNWNATGQQTVTSFKKIEGRIKARNIFY